MNDENIWIDKLQNATESCQRIDIAEDPECSIQVLEIMIREDTEESVVLAASNNEKCPQYLKDVANSRFENDSQSKYQQAVCPIPWVHIGIQQNGDYRMCCQMIGTPNGKLNNDGKFENIKDCSISDARNHQVYKNIRVQMLNGEKPTECNLCYQEEVLSLNSKRKNMLMKYNSSEYATNTDSDGTIDTEKFPLRYIDIRFGNLCNLKCRYCGPTDSSLWYDDFVKLSGKKSFNYYNSKQYDLKLVNKNWKVDSVDFEWYESEQFWQNIKSLLPYIDRYYFTGGEPTINKTHFSLLQLIIDEGFSGNVTLEYNSNMVAIPEKLYELWKKFRRVEIGCSLDGYQEYAKYLRYPSEWPDLEKNIDRLGRSTRNIIGGISTTVNVYNILNFLDLSKWLVSKNYKNIKKTPSYHVLMGPNEMSIQVLPADTKEIIKAEYEKFYQYLETTYGKNTSDRFRRVYAGIINFMMAKDQSHLLPKLCKTTSDLDNIRDESIEQVIPWLAEILKKYK